MKQFSVALFLILSSGAFAVERRSLDEGWLFSLNGGAAVTVDVPHDWSIASAPDGKSETGKEWGYYAAGSGTYVRKFSLAEADLKDDLSLSFDGVLGGEVFVRVNDGEPVRGSRYGYTGFVVPLKGKVRAGENTVSVSIANPKLPASRWYRGCGIFRSVWLERRTAPYLEPLTLNVRTDVTPDGARASVLLSGVEVGSDGARRTVTKTIDVANPELWTPETPKLHETEFCGEKVRYGIRTISVDAANGFRLNGKTVELHGACVHHDHGPLGAASWPEAERRKALQLKRAGFNAVRTSHNPVSESFLAACDEVGLLVLDDLFDGREKSKTKGDYAEVFAEDWRKDVDWVVRRDRIHPSVVMWSIGNEILEAAELGAAVMTRTVHGAIDALDGTRPVTQALNLWGDDWTAIDPLAAELDVVGFNYLERFTETDHARLPERVIVYTETFASEAAMVWRRILKHPYVIGEFVWTGIDYLGETGIGRNFNLETEKWGEHWYEIPQFPWHGAACGDIDLVGTRKPISFYRETLWNPSAPTRAAVRERMNWTRRTATTLWSVWPTYDHWTFPGDEHHEVTVEVYSRQPRVRLTVNGEIVDERINRAANAWKQEFDVLYEPGEVVAEGLSQDGSPVDRAVLRTAGEPVGVRLSRETIGRLTFVTAEVVDANGTVCPHADREVTFEGEVLGTCSGNLADNVPAPSRVRKTYHGRALGIIRNR